jgi:hypothetical protein
MGLRNKLRKIADKLSGEYSAAAPEEIKPFERNVDPEGHGEMVRAKLVRPREKHAKKD